MILLVRISQYLRFYFKKKRTQYLRIIQYCMLSSLLKGRRYKYIRSKVLAVVNTCKTVVPLMIVIEDIGAKHAKKELLLLIAPILQFDYYI